MKKFLMLLLLSQSIFAQNNSNIDHAKRYNFVIQNFKTESGKVLPEAHIIYGT